MSPDDMMADAARAQVMRANEEEARAARIRKNVAERRIPLTLDDVQGKFRELSKNSALAYSMATLIEFRLGEQESLERVLLDCLIKTIEDGERAQENFRAHMASRDNPMILSARSEIPRLLDAIDRQRDELNQIREATRALNRGRP